jgi:hypothetical protein
MKSRRGLTTAYIILSLISSIVTWVILYVVYIFVFGPALVIPANTILGDFGSKYPQMNLIVANVVSQTNAAFVLIAIGVFFFMLVAPYIFEPISGGSETY